MLVALKDFNIMSTSGPFRSEVFVREGMVCVFDGVRLERIFTSGLNPVPDDVNRNEKIETRF